MNTIAIPTPSLFIATPMYGGMCTGRYLQSIIQLSDMCRQIGWNYSLSMIWNESLITRARNALVKQFFASPCTHLFFIDADIGFNPMEAQAMVLANKDVICGIYPKKEINWPRVRNAMAAGVPDDQLRFHTGSLVANLVNYQGVAETPVDQPLEIWEGGTGFMLIKREVLEKMKPACAVYRNDVSGSAGVGDEIVEYFKTSIDGQTGRLLSEDYDFCHTWRKRCGGKLYAAPWVNLAHFGTYAFEGRVADPIPQAPAPPTVKPKRARKNREV